MKTFSASSRTQPSSIAISVLVTVSGIMISTCGSPPACLRSTAASMIARDLHPVETRLQDPEAAAAGAEHRVRLFPPLERGHEAVRIGIADAVDEGVDLAAEHLVVARQELVQRRVEQPDRHRQPVHRLEDPDEVGPLQPGAARRARAPPPPGSRRGSSAGRSAAGRRGTCAPSGRDRCPPRRTRAPSASPRAGPRSRAPSSCAPRRPSRARSRTGPVGSGVTTGTSPTTTSPVPPLIEMTSPSRTVISTGLHHPADLAVDRRP